MRRRSVDDRVNAAQQDVPDFVVEGDDDGGGWEVREVLLGFASKIENLIKFINTLPKIRTPYKSFKNYTMVFIIL